MCGRFCVDEQDEQYREFLARLYELDTDDSPRPSLAAGEVFPTDAALALTAGGVKRMGWGFTRYDGKGRVINARSETLLEKPMFLTPMRAGRCLIPASGYFEWAHDGAKKRKYLLRPEDGGLFCFAGLWRAEPGAALPLFVIVTAPAADGIRLIHERMPAILPKEAHDAWLLAPDPVRGGARADVGRAAHRLCALRLKKADKTLQERTGRAARVLIRL